MNKSTYFKLSEAGLPVQAIRSHYISAADELDELDEFVLVNGML